MVGVVDVSVINQMLRDLDERQASQPASHPVAPMMGRSQKKSPLLYITAILAVAIIVATYYLYSPTSESVTNDRVEQSLATEPETSIELQSTANVAAIDNQEASVDQQQAVVEQQPEPVMQKPETVATEPVVDTDSVKTDEQVRAAESEPVPRAEQTSAATDDSPRVIKSNPNHTNRSRAEALFDSTVAEFGTPLSTAQYQAILGIDPAFHQVRIEWFSQLVQTDTVAFEQQVTTALQTWPEVFQYRQMLARHWVISEPRKAYDLLLSQMPSIDRAPDYHGLIAYSAQQMGDAGLATKKYELLLESYPDRADWWFALALLQEQLGDQSKALAAYQQSLRFPGLNTTTRDYAQQRVRAIQGY